MHSSRTRTSMIGTLCGVSGNGSGLGSCFSNGATSGATKHYFGSQPSTAEMGAEDYAPGLTSDGTMRSRRSYKAWAKMLLGKRSLHGLVTGKDYKLSLSSGARRRFSAVEAVVEVERNWWRRQGKGREEREGRDDF